MAEEADLPEEIVRLLAHFAAELDKDAQEVQAGLTAGLLPPWVEAFTPPGRYRMMCLGGLE